MAELTSGRFQPRVDLTPMVDLAFLLITFFMLTTRLNAERAMDVAMPDISDPKEIMTLSEQRTMTILLGKDHQIRWYWGLLDEPIEGPQLTAHGKYGIRKEILDKMEKVRLEMKNSAKGLIVLIKADKQASYGDLVNVLDEMSICRVPQYTLAEIDPVETKLFQLEK